MGLFGRKRESAVEQNTIFNTGQTPLEKVFDGLLTLRFKHATEMKSKIILISKENRIRLQKKNLDMRVAIYTLCFTSALIKDRDIKDKYHLYFKEKGSNDKGFVNQIFGNIAYHYPKYYDAYNNFIESKNGLILGATLVEILINDNPDFFFPSGDIIASGFLLDIFSIQLKETIETIGILSKENNIELL